MKLFQSCFDPLDIVLIFLCPVILFVFLRGSLWPIFQTDPLPYFSGSPFEQIKLFLAPMKSLAFILAFMVLALSCMPCNDDECAMEAGKNKTEFAKQTPGQDKDHTEDCSPFCHCSCCAGFSINHGMATGNLLPVICANNFSSYLPENLIEISIPVWQPPKIRSFHF
jgi:hypothetical protein